MAKKDNFLHDRDFFHRERDTKRRTRKYIGIGLFVIATSALLLLNTPANAASQSVSGATYEALTDIQTQIANNEVDAAFVNLQTLHQEVDSETIDEALVLQMLGYTEMSRNNYTQAIDYLEKSLALSLLPESVQTNVIYMVAQLYAAQENYKKALVYANKWFVTLKTPNAENNIFMANIYAQTANYKEAIPYVEQAISLSDAPKESWYQLLIASNFELKRYQQATKVLTTVISLWPEKGSYWEQLASVYMLLNQDKKSLATLQLAWKNNVLEKESSIKSVVQLAIAQGIPEHAARLIESAFDKTLLPVNKDYLETLANAWVAAKEYPQAISAFEKLAEVSGESEPYLKIANLYVEKAQWQPAEAALNKALAGTLEKPGKAWLIMGIALTEQQKFAGGLDAFRKARAFEYSESQANNWLKYAGDLQRQHNWITRNSEAHAAD